jgi:hypothetical protein
MKKWISYLLAFYILFSAIVPCSIFDNCEDEHQTQQSSKPLPVKDCNNCSPFSICASAHGFIINFEALTLEPAAFYNSSSYSEYYLSTKSEYFFTHFQPPRKT